MQIARICRRCLALVALVFVASTAAAGSPPNFVVVLADDLGYGDASCYGGWIETPHLDRMASRGVRFTDFHSSGNVCSPTRAGLLTGRYQQRAGIPGVVYASDTRAAHYSGLQPSEITLPELLLEAGYDTALFGKWHLGYHPKYNPLNHGFRQFRGYLSGNVDYHTHLDNQGRHDWWNGRQLHPEQGYTTHLITRYAREFLRKRRDNPFFLLVAYEAVHNPYQGPQDPPVRSTDVPGMDHDRRPIKDVYADMMREMDDGMAAILNSLVASGLESNTLVFFFSDNGPTTNGSAGPLRGYKGSDWEGGHRVPAIAWWPGHLDPAVNSQLTSSLDLMPTLLELANVAPPAGLALDGVSLVPTVTDAAPIERRQFYWDHAMRDGPWKLKVDGQQSQLFDLRQDLREQRDLADEHPTRVEAMHAAWQQWQADVRADATPQPATAGELDD